MCEDVAQYKRTVPKGRSGPSLVLGEPMELEAARVGTRVRVQLDCRKPHRRGAVGTIKKRYGIPEYTAFEVLFADGQRELFWDHQLEEAKESSPKGWWVFW
jgi:hypothetical protein